MGFTRYVFRLEERLLLGDLEIVTTCSGRSHFQDGDDWDALALHVRDLGGHGSFFSGADVRVRHIPLDIIRQLLPPTVLAVSNNSISLHTVVADTKPSSPASAMTEALSDLEYILEHWGQPTAIIGSGNGWSFTGALESLNRQIFPADIDDLPAAVERSGLVPGARIVQGGPGVVVSMRDGRLAGVDAADFVEMEKATMWPQRHYRPTVRTNKVSTPLTSAPEAFRTEDFDKLRDALNEFGCWLVGTPWFLQLIGLSAAELAGRRRGAMLALQTDWDGTGIALAWAPGDCSFELSDESPEMYVTGATCWAADLLALFDLTINPRAFTMGHYVEWWSGSPLALRNTLASALRSFLHPARKPQTYLRAYKRQLGLSAPASPLIRGVALRESPPPLY
jgi:hypothetical protein